MKLLLDTHAMYWYIEGNSQLSATAQTLIQNSSNRILISPASYWEIAIKFSIRKLPLSRSYPEFLNLAFNQYGFGILPIEPSHTEQLTGLPFHHRDPFDRLLVAQAITENVPIVSADSMLDSYSIQRLW